MFLMSSFTDEYVKIAASKQEAGYMQTRQGKRPIRAHNLLKKADAKTEAVTQAAGGLKSLLGRIWKAKVPIALLGGGAAGMKGLEEYGLEPWEYGRRAQEMGAQY
jgi:hypothetical protein